MGLRAAIVAAALCAKPNLAIAQSSNCSAFLDTKTIKREALVELAKNGLGAVLRTVTVSADRVSGRFVGWRLGRLPESACIKSVGLHEGDLIMRVNGRSLQRPEQAHESLQALAQARTLTIDLLRGKKPLALVFAVADTLPPSRETPNHPPAPASR